MGVIDRFWQCHISGGSDRGDWSIVTMSLIWRSGGGWLIDIDNVTIWRLRWGVIDWLWQCHRYGGSGGGWLIDCDNVTDLEAQVGVDWSIVTMLRSGGSVGGNWSIVTMSQIWMLRWWVIDRLWHCHSCGGSDGGWLTDCDKVTVVEAQVGGDWSYFLLAKTILGLLKLKYRYVDFS